MIVAVLQQRARIRLENRDVFVSTVGGARIQEPAGDLATAIAVASAWKDKAVPTDVVAIGELGLAGELRRVRDLPQRLAEAARLGFRRAIVPLEAGNPAASLREVDGMSVFESPDLESALQVLDLARADAVPIFPPEPDGYEGPQFGVA
jgi:DNA repair protein RadA/Sms